MACGPTRVRPAARVAVAALAQGGAEPVLRLQGRPDGHEIVEVAFQPEPGPWKGLRVVAGLGDETIQPLGGLAPRQRHSDAEFGDFALDRIEPMPVAGPFFEQAVA